MCLAHIWLYTGETKPTSFHSFIISFLLFYCRKFDLKGSTVDREASDKELEKQLPTLKDNDFIKQHVKIQIGPTAREKLFANLNADVDVSINSF